MNSVYVEIDFNFFFLINGILWYFFKVIIEINWMNYVV